MGGPLRKLRIEDPFDDPGRSIVVGEPNVVTLASSLGLLSGSGTTANPWTGVENIAYAGQLYFFPDGEYFAASWPNWAIDGIAIVGGGKSILRCAPAAPGPGLKFTNPVMSAIKRVRVENLYIQGNANTLYGLYAEFMSHSIFRNIRVLGAATDAFRFAGCLVKLSLDELECTVNAPGMVLAPTNGLTLVASGAINCNTLMIRAPVFEGLGGAGLNYIAAEKCITIAGVSEGNGKGQFLNAGAVKNTNIGTWYEANGIDIDCDGYQNRFTDCQSSVLTRVNAGATGASANIFEGGEYNSFNIFAGSSQNRLGDMRVRIAGGTFTDSGTNTMYDPAHHPVVDVIALAVLGKLPVFANNAAAAAVLFLGMEYRTGGDPDLVCTVH